MLEPAALGVPHSAAGWCSSRAVQPPQQGSAAPARPSSSSAVHYAVPSMRCTMQYTMQYHQRHLDIWAMASMPHCPPLRSQAAYTSSTLCLPPKQKSMSGLQGGRSQGSRACGGPLCTGQLPVRVLSSRPRPRPKRRRSTSSGSSTSGGGSGSRDRKPGRASPPHACQLPLGQRLPPLKGRQQLAQHPCTYVAGGGSPRRSLCMRSYGEKAMVSGTHHSQLLPAAPPLHAQPAAWLLGWAQ